MATKADPRGKALPKGAEATLPTAKGTETLVPFGGIAASRPPVAFLLLGAVGPPGGHRKTSFEGPCCHVAPPGQGPPKQNERARGTWAQDP